MTLRSNYYIKTSEKDLELELLIAIGTTVIFISNLLIYARLVNSAHKVVKQTTNNPKSLPHKYFSKI